MEHHEPTGDDLWMVVAIIQEFRLDTVTLVLERLPEFSGMTVSECRGFGQEKVGGDRARGDDREPRMRSSGVVDFTPKVKVEIAVAGRDGADVVIEAIARTARTGRRGDGKIFAWPVARALRVRTLETGRRALEASGVASPD